MIEQSEFEQSEAQRDLEILRDFVPEWMNERLEPWTPPPVDSVVPPTWNKARWELGMDTAGSAEAPDSATVSFIAGVQIGSAFVPKIVTANGSFADIP